MRALVTGAGGFIGYHMTSNLLADGHEPVLVDSFLGQQPDEAFRDLVHTHQLKVLELDLSDEDSWNALGDGFDVVFHFAAINGTRHFYERPYEVLDTNIQLMRSMLAWHQRTCPGARIIWTSSSEVYAGVPGLEIPTAEPTPVGVDDVFNPRYSYAVSKLAGELLLINYARARDAIYTIVRPHNIYGPRMGQNHVIPEFALRIKRREDPFRIYGAEEMRSFCYITDFIGGLMAILGSGAADGHVLHLGDDRYEIRMRDLAEKMFQISGWHPRTEMLPAPKGSVPRRKPSLEKACRLLGYQPTVDLDRGLVETYRWYDEHSLDQSPKGSI